MKRAFFYSNTINKQDQVYHSGVIINLSERKLTIVIVYVSTVLFQVYRKTLLDGKKPTLCESKRGDQSDLLGNNLRSYDSPIVPLRRD